MITSMSAVEFAAIDTNILVYSIDEVSPFHSSARSLVEQAREPAAGLCVTPQVLAEFFAVATNARRVESPCTSAEAIEAIVRFLALPGMALLPVPSNVVERWCALAKMRSVTGRSIFDLQLAATILGNGVTRLYTFNVADFEGIPGLDVVRPVVTAAP
jgi:toxin-antitoxin system PIN domain toxin